MKRKTVSVEGHWDFEQGFRAKFQWFEGSNRRACFNSVARIVETPKLGPLETSLLRCVEQRLTMCKRVVIIKQFRELSLACLYTAVLSDAQPAIRTGSEKMLAEL